MDIRGYSTQSRSVRLLKTAAQLRERESALTRILLLRFDFQETFQQFMKLPQTPTWKRTKITVKQLHDILGGRLTTSIRYGALIVTGATVKVKWKRESGEFSFAGTYGL